MPTINSNSNGGQIIYDANDWLSGINQVASASTDTILGRVLSDNTREFNPYYRLGTACPGPDLSTPTNGGVPTGAITNIVVVDGTYSIGISDDGKLHPIQNSDGVIIEDGVTWAHSITGATVGEDVVLYNVGSTQYAFYSWYNGTDADVGRFDLNVSSPTFVDTYMSGTAASGAKMTKDTPLPMIVGADDVLYIGNGNILKSFDGQNGANGTFNAAKLTLPYGHVITSMVKLGNPNSLVIFTYRKNSGGNTYRSESYAWFWDYLNDDPFKVVALNDNFVRGGFNWQGTIGVFTTGRRDDFTTQKKSKIQLWDGSRFQIADYFDTAIPLNGGVEVSPNHIMFKSEDTLYSYGSVFGGLNPVLNKIISQGSYDGGCVKILTDQLTVVTGDAGSSDAILQKMVVDRFGDAGRVRTISVFPGFPIYKKGKVKTVTVEFLEPNSGGRQFSLYLLPDDGFGNDTDYTIISALTSVDNNELIKTYNRLNDDADMPTFNSMALLMQWASGDNTAAPKIKRIIIEYEYINI